MYCNSHGSTEPDEQRSPVAQRDTYPSLAIFPLEAGFHSPWQWLRPRLQEIITSLQPATASEIDLLKQGITRPRIKRKDSRRLKL